MHLSPIVLFQSVSCGVQGQTTGNGVQTKTVQNYKFQYQFMDSNKLGSLLFISVHLTSIKVFL